MTTDPEPITKAINDFMDYIYNGDIQNISPPPLDHLNEGQHKVAITAIANIIGGRHNTTTHPSSLEQLLAGIAVSKARRVTAYVTRQSYSTEVEQVQEIAFKRSKDHGTEFFYEAKKVAELIVTMNISTKKVDTLIGFLYD